MAQEHKQHSNRAGIRILIVCFYNRPKAESAKAESGNGAEWLNRLLGNELARDKKWRVNILMQRGNGPIEVIGIDHIYIAVSDLRRSERFYDEVMEILGFRKNTFMNEGDHHIQYYNRHFGFVLRQAHSRTSRHDPLSPGLHHFCFRVEDSGAVDAIARRFKDAGVDFSPPQVYPEYAPDYYAIFFSDPDGIRLEITNYRQERRRRHDEWESMMEDKKRRAGA